LANKNSSGLESQASAERDILEQTERDGYHVIQWRDDSHRSFVELLELAPELVCGKRVAITSCDSGPYAPSSDEVDAGWTRVGSTAISAEIDGPLELPAVGFDEWYIFDEVPHVVPTRSHVNQFDFSLLDESDATESFWEQIGETHPLHVLGDGAQNVFFVTRDRTTYDRVGSLLVATE